MSAKTAPPVEQPTPEQPEPARPAASSAFIDADLMERAIKLRAEGLTMKAVGVELGVKATGYLARKIKEQYGADALAKPAKPAAQGTGQPNPAEAQSAVASQPSADEKAPAKPARRRKPATAKQEG